MGMGDKVMDRWINLVLRGKIDYPKNRATKARRLKNKIARRSRRVNRMRR